jgi:hypothetical protein
MKKDLLYSILCLAFCIIIGGAVYEHVNVVPVWSAAPPVSLSMFQGKYGLKPELFWMMIHPVNLLLFVLTLIFHWKSQRRKNILIVMSSYVLILVVTSIYFVPELIRITTTTYGHSADAGLTARASLWEILSTVRLSILVILALVLFIGLTKSSQAQTNPGQRTTRKVAGKLAFDRSEVIH